MILPSKHLSIRDSLLGAGTVIIRELKTPKTVSRLWEKLRDDPAIGSYHRFTLILDFLFSINAIKLEDNLVCRGQQ